MPVVRIFPMGDHEPVGIDRQGDFDPVFMLLARLVLGDAGDMRLVSAVDPLALYRTFPDPVDGLRDHPFQNPVLHCDLPPPGGSSEHGLLKRPRVGRIGDCFSIAVVSTRMEGTICLPSGAAPGQAPQPSPSLPDPNVSGTCITWNSSRGTPQKTSHTTFSWKPCTTSESDMSSRCFRIMMPYHQPGWLREDCECRSGRSKEPGPHCSLASRSFQKAATVGVPVRGTITSPKKRGYYKTIFKLKNTYGVLFLCELNIS